MLMLNEWATPASPYQEERIGNFHIGKTKYRVGRHPYYGMDGYRYSFAPDPLTITTLQELKDGKWEDWMVDTPTDYRAMQKYAEMSYGNVLTTGLGLGLLVHELCKNNKVESVTVIELNPSVITLVQKYLPEDNRIRIQCGDFWEFIKSDNSKWDWIIVDLWVWKSAEKYLKIFNEEILPDERYLESKYPEAQVVFHGFAGISKELPRDITKLWGLRECFMISSAHLANISLR